MNAEAEQKLLREADKGAKARAILEDSMVKEALEAIETGILDLWKKSPIRDSEGQMHLRLLYKIYSDFKGYLQQAIESGKMAHVQLEQERSLQERAKAAVREFRR